MPFRGFVAVEVGPRPRLVEVLDALDRAGADLKVVRAENLHVTLKFLGETHESALEGLDGTLRGAVAGERPFDLHVAGTGTFPSTGVPRVLWAGIDPCPPLDRIAARIEEGCSRLGFAKEGRAFSPHLTLARMRSSRGSQRARAALREAVVDERVRVSEVVLMRSDPGPGGPAYEPLRRAGLEA